MSLQDTNLPVLAQKPAYIIKVHIRWGHVCRIMEVKLLNSWSLSEPKRRLSKYFTAKRQTLLLNKRLNKYKRLSAIKIMLTKKLSKTHIKGKRKSPFGSQLFEEFALYFSRTRGNSWPFDRVHLHCVLKNIEMLT